MAGSDLKSAASAGGPVEPHVPAYFGFVERIGHGVIEGWAIDRLDLSRHPSVRVMAGGQLLGSGVCDIYREHVHKSGAGDGRYGFRVAFNDMAIPLESISVVIDDPAHPFRLPLTQQATAEARTGDTSAYIGLVESVTADFIEGWAIDRRDPGRHLRVNATAGGHLLGSAICNLYREHLQNSGAGDGRYGFRVAIEATSPIHDIAVVVDDQIGAYNLAFSPEASTALNRLKSAPSVDVPPSVPPTKEAAAAPSDAAMAALEARVQTLQAELMRFKSALAQSIEKFSGHSTDGNALAPLSGELRDVSPIPPAQVPWEARGFYRQLLRKLGAAA